MKNNLKSIIIEGLGLIVGCILISIGLNMFLGPYTIAPGGLSGLSVILSKVSGLSVSTIMLILGLPLIICSIKILGKKDSIKTYYNGIGATGLLSFLSRKRKSNK